MTRSLLNSAVLTAAGHYTYRLVTPDEARAWAARGPWTSTIGYPETAALAAELLGVPVPTDRRVIRMEPGDEALVLRLRYEAGAPRIDPADKGRLGAALRDPGQVELGLLRRVELATGEHPADLAWQATVREVVDLLAQTRDTFRSRQLQHARERLEALLETP